MNSLRRTLLFLLILSGLVITCTPLLAQTLIDTVFVGTEPAVVAVNPATNMIYVINQGDSPPDVAVIDGSTDQVVATIPVGNNPDAMVVNPFTNRIYVVNDNDNTVTLIDGATNNTYTIQVGSYPWYIAVNTVTNKIYVTDSTVPGYVTVIDGATNLVTATIPVRDAPATLAVNPATNMIYVCNWGENTVSVIDGATNTNIKTILVGHTPNGIAVNSVTNMIYVTNYSDNTMSIINGSNNNVVATLTLTDTPGGEYLSPMAINQVTGLVYVGTNDANVAIVDGTNHIIGTLPINYDPNAMAIDSVTNKIYIAAGENELVMIDGNSNTIDDTLVGNGDDALGINQGTNRIYTANYGDNTISVVAGANASPMQWISVNPCRLVDTRKTGNPVLGGASETFFVPQLGGCNIPATAAAYSLNVTVVPWTALGYLTIWPTGEAQPYVSTMNSLDGRTKANAAIVPAGYSGGVNVYATNTTDVVLDINGYFAPAGSQTYQFYPMTPCRVVDTRLPIGPLGGPNLGTNQTRDFPVLQSPCFQGISQPQAYSFNMTVSPNPAGQPLNYLTVWPASES